MLIASAKDEALRANYEQARTKIVRSVAEACTTQAWTPDAQHCFAAAKADTDLRACEKKFPPPAASQPHPVKAEVVQPPPANAKVLQPNR